MGCVCGKNDSVSYDTLPLWVAYNDLWYTYECYGENEIKLLTRRANTKEAALEALIREAATRAIEIKYDVHAKQWHAGDINYIHQGPCCGCVDTRYTGYNRVFFFHDTHLNQHVCQLFYES